MASEDKDRRSRMAHSSVNAPAKKDGAGGRFTWGKADDVQDYEPVGVQGPGKVSVSAVNTDMAKSSGASQEVPRNSSEHFPSLAASLQVKAERPHGRAAKPLSQPDARLNFALGTLLAAGGAIAFARKGSLPSLLGGGGSGAALVGSGMLAARYPKRAFMLGTVVSLLLTAGMLPRAIRARKMMPAGMVALIGVVASLYNLSKLRGSSAK
eukprot:TRINITY_DN93683_c0_g1_i1.p1 TRINITY_DN93683_c0_g1~~TRINITY_DN93683_c0_g1_i1.p1  ORF type:complete len:210 (-),score=43.86 TRINITY_DN93683_c0_g1_i1:277-906(-)